MKAEYVHFQDLTRDILDGIVDGVVVLDLAGQVLVWNRAIEEMTGIPAHDATGKMLRDLFPANRALLQHIEKTVSTGRSYSDDEALLTLKNRPSIAAGITTSLVTDHEGKPASVILSIRNQASMQDLKERIRRSDRLAAIGMIATGIAHEIKNPLVGIRGAAQLMKSEIYAGVSPHKNFGEYLDVIVKEADRLNAVLEGMLDFTRIKQHEIQPLNIHGILDRALVFQEELLRKNRIVLSRQYDPSLPEVNGNYDQLVQVFLNLIMNAIDAMPSGGKLSIVTRMSDLFSSVHTNSKKQRLMVVKVIDEGMGIEEKNLQNIFTPFFTTKDRGVGLGLALSYQIIQEHLGIINVESCERKGTTFRVYLPLAE
ncbi:MAG: ATP-binding protein [Nitrospirota bacterium]